MDAIFILDKPSGPNCQQILKNFRKRYRKHPIGYTGTLDPLASGVLPIFIGGATKLIPYLSEEKKRYRAILKLGEYTDTLDSEGKISKRIEVPPINQETIENLFSLLIGKGSQTPPAYSAIKIDGKPLYRYARSGIEIEVKPRAIEIFSLNLLHYETPYLEFECKVSRGTYIRSLGLEIAEKLKTTGHLVRLRRLESGPFEIKNARNIDDWERFIEDPTEFYAYLQKIFHLSTESLPSHTIQEPEKIQRLLQGQKIVEILDMPEKDPKNLTNPFWILKEKDRLLAISEAKIEDRSITFQPKRILNFSSGNTIRPNDHLTQKVCDASLSSLRSPDKPD